MASLKDTMVSGSLRATDTLYGTTLQTQIIKAPTSSGGTTYGPGSNGQVLKSNGTTAYWGADNNSDTHRPIQVNGTEILGNNTTALNLKPGSNVSITNSSGTVTIAATDTNTWRPIGKTSSDAAAGNTVIADSTARTISAGTSSAYSVTNLTADHVVAAWRFSGGYTDNNPPADITVTTANGSYTIQASNLLASGITMQPIFIKP